MPDPARPHDVTALALAMPGAPAQVPIRAHLDAVTAELARRADQHP